MIKILFVCTGNVFRSMSAEYALKDWLKKNKIKGFNVESSGTYGGPHQKPEREAIAIFSKIGIDVSEHKSRKITEKIVQHCDFIVAMSTDHKEFIKENFGLDVPLFNEIAYGKKTPLLDNCEVYPTLGAEDKEFIEYNRKIVNYIIESMPYFAKNMNKFIKKFKKYSCDFCDFVEGKEKKHTSGLPFITLYETKNTVSFLSEDIPLNKDSHILVIPKKHYTELENMPENIRHELIDHVALAERVLKRLHGACNVLQNDGRSSGQSVFHVHFHIIPRDKEDKIEIERWKHGKYPLKKFIENHNKLKKLFEETSKLK